jgi:Rod binding domain-containing protein
MTSLPPIDQSLLPADIRKASDADRKQYTAALGFERTLINELTKAMAETAKPADDDSQPQDAATSLYMDMLPDQLADSVIEAGGFGLARTLYDGMKAQAK